MGFYISYREVSENFGSLDFVELIYLLIVTYVNAALDVHSPYPPTHKRETIAII